MAASIFDGPSGFAPASECGKFRILKVAAASSDKIYKGAPVMVLSGYAVPYDEDNASVSQVYIAAHHVDAAPGAVTDLIVYDDPDMEFYVLGAGDDYAITMSGQAVGANANGAASGGPDDGTNDSSDCVLSLTTTAATPTYVLPFVITGLAGHPNNSASEVQNKTPILTVKIADAAAYIDTLLDEANQ